MPFEQRAEDAIWCNRSKVEINGEKVSVSKAQVKMFKEDKNSLINDFIESLEKRFPDDELLVLHSISRIINASRTQVDVDDVKTVEEHYHLKNLDKEVDKLREVKMQFSTVEKVRTFAGILVANYSENLPQISFISEVYLNLMMASVEAERMFSEM